MKSKKKKSNLLSFALLILGLAIIAYPIFSQWYYKIDANNVIARYETATSELDQAELQRKWDLALAYNHTLDPSRLADPWTNKEKEGVAEYARMLEVNEQIGYIEIPKISQKLPIYAGTSENVLQKGAGHLEGTSLPTGGPSTHSVITAHRGLPTAELFTSLDKMEEGDIFYIHVLNRVLAYKVDLIQVVEPSNFDPVLVVEGHDYSTLLTCTPYSINTHRLLVRGERTDYDPAVEEKAIRDNFINNNYKYYLLASSLVILVLIVLIYLLRKKIKALYKKIIGLRGK